MRDDLTICANCRFCVPACEPHQLPSSLWLPAACVVNERQVTNVVTGKLEWFGAVECERKNDGHCPDFVYGPRPLRTDKQEKPHKHWWQR